MFDVYRDETKQDLKQLCDRWVSVLQLFRHVAKLYDKVLLYVLKEFMVYRRNDDTCSIILVEVFSC